jgi:hypothetical protein
MKNITLEKFTKDLNMFSDYLYEVVHMFNNPLLEQLAEEYEFLLWAHDDDEDDTDEVKSNFPQTYNRAWNDKEERTVLMLGFMSFYTTYTRMFSYTMFDDNHEMRKFAEDMNNAFLPYWNAFSDAVN